MEAINNNVGIREKLIDKALIFDIEQFNQLQLIERIRVRPLNNDFQNN